MLIGRATHEGGHWSRAHQPQRDPVALMLKSDPVALFLKVLGVESEMDMEGGGKSIAMSCPFFVFDTKNTWSVLLIPISS